MHSPLLKRCPMCVVRRSETITLNSFRRRSTATSAARRRTACTETTRRCRLRARSSTGRLRSTFPRKEVSSSLSSVLFFFCFIFFALNRTLSKYYQTLNSRCFFFPHSSTLLSLLHALFCYPFPVEFLPVSFFTFHANYSLELTSYYSHSIKTLESFSSCCATSRKLSVR